MIHCSKFSYKMTIQYGLISLKIHTMPSLTLKRNTRYGNQDDFSDKALNTGKQKYFVRLRFGLLATHLKKTRKKYSHNCKLIKVIMAEQLEYHLRHASTFRNIKEYFIWIQTFQRPLYLVSTFWFFFVD